VSHGDTIIDTDCVKLERNPAGFPDGFFGNVCQPPSGERVRNNVDIGITDGNKTACSCLWHFSPDRSHTANSCRSSINAFFNFVASHIYASFLVHE